LREVDVLEFVAEMGVPGIDHFFLGMRGKNAEGVRVYI